MALDPYAACPCGSGKKFKWCCQDISGPIDQAMALDADGQHEPALRAMDEVVKAHSANPEAWGRQAELLARNDKLEQAEAALAKAFAINPNYPYGHLLRAQFRLMEGEMIGGLMLLRKAAENYAPNAVEPLSAVYRMIFDLESERNNPVAARAAMQQLVRLRPTDAELRQAFETMFGERSRLPTVARREYRFRPASGGLSPQQKEDWERRLAQAATGKLSDSRQAFTDLTKQYPDDAAGWFNLALACAWLGDNRAALEALDQHLALETDEARASEAVALDAVLRCGAGVEELADVCCYRVLFRIHEPQSVVRALQELESQNRLMIDRVDEEHGVISGRILEAPALAVSLPGLRLVPLAASLMLVQNVLQLRHTSRASVSQVAADLQRRLGEHLSPPQEDTTFAHFGEVILPALAFPSGPPGPTAPGEYELKLREHVARYFEEVWPHRPLKSLSGVPPIDAAGSPQLRQRLLGVIQFLNDCLEASAPRSGAGAGLALYDFEHLRHKLNLGGPAPVAAAGSAPDLGAMNAAELAGLKADALTDDQLEQAFRMALKLDASELAGSFAQALVGRPGNPQKPDRYPFYNHLAQLRLDGGDSAGAIRVLEQAAQADVEQNEGQRRNEYDLKRGKILAKNGDADAAEAAFTDAISRASGDPKFMGSAAEAFLGARQGAKALKFAEQGLAAARARNSRDLEQYFLELVAAAKKQA
jgi:Tetratricopeptide repeat